MREKLQRFMYGRYGADDFSRFLSTVSIVLFVVSLLFTGNARLVFDLVVVAAFAYNIFRTLSKNRAARVKENYSYMRIRRKVTGWFGRVKRRIKDSKTHRFFRCPTCHTEVRVPKGKGNIMITCPKCGARFKKKS